MAGQSVKKINKIIATQSYHAAIEASARLAAYSTARFLHEIGSGSYQSRADELAHTDLLLLAISVRRLSEVADEEQSLKKLSISFRLPYRGATSADFYPTQKRVNVWDVLGVIIHSREYQLFKNDFSVRTITNEFEGDLYKAYVAAGARRDISAVAYVESDRKVPMVFSVSELVKEVTTFIHDIEEVLSEQSIYVGAYAD